ncbi:MAG: DNA polymerase III subunit delta [Candidatus Wildermuthbacteria bacterium RIFCSPHIGHO2_01_FULL_45_20]|uniref:DNA polymerase III subunit delta n=1 Tax=Candidatus Wildermuthbacteria bacterium RIFCSPHIGHO2_02_FULL_45_25 TaxID=1802450 RepID=A0A1G2R295_9BACT|nr:MAG: DNA polymerase III subunit delta [Candidatus Wildermuthbacteria bacterium RIFCSPHIGHO2_01_FULL_45_20]OHA66362.1 MAG: DNA polymerase III subunit delta [Candidatus Wildermuthbacteria bacterium RIFCSPHIGHO2_02_FULL_45_25]
MLLFLYGPDTYRQKQKLAEIIESYRVRHGSALGAYEYEAKEVAIADIVMLLKSGSLFESKKLVALKNAFDNLELEHCAKDIKELLKTSEHLLVFTQDSLPKKSSPLFKFLHGNAKTQEFLPLEGAKLRLWIEKECALYSVVLSREAESLLEQVADGDTWLLVNEIRKLAAFSGRGKIEITRETAEKLLPGAKAQTDIFQTIEAMARRDKARALSLISKHLQDGESPFYLFSMFVFQFRSLLEVSDAVARGAAPSGIAQKLSMHPYAAQKNLRLIQEFPPRALRVMYHRLFQLDLRMKTGQIDPAAGLDLFIATL